MSPALMRDFLFKYDEVVFCVYNTTKVFNQQLKINIFPLEKHKIPHQLIYNFMLPHLLLFVYLKATLNINCTYIYHKY
jgi:hypothetical protein